MIRTKPPKKDLARRIFSHGFRCFGRALSLSSVASTSFISGDAAQVNRSDYSAANPRSVLTSWSKTSERSLSGFTKDFRSKIGFGAVIALCTGLLRRYIPESPRWLGSLRGFWQRCYCINQRQRKVYKAQQFLATELRIDRVLSWPRGAGQFAGFLRGGRLLRLVCVFGPFYFAGRCGDAKLGSLVLFNR